MVKGRQGGFAFAGPTAVIPLVTLIGLKGKEF
jgi:hypothetical protein